MKASIYVYMLIFALIVSCNDKPTQIIENEINQGSLFIIGGGPRPDALMTRMLEEAGLFKKGYVVILPMSSEVPDSAIYWAASGMERLGVEDIAGFNFPTEAEDINNEWVDSLANASLIYISGGDQNRFMKIVGNTQIETAINLAYNNGAMIAGTSAGAAVMSEKMITGNELKYSEYRPTSRVVESDNIEFSKGLGLIKTAVIDQHFVWRSRYNRLLSAVIELPDLLGIGIDESTAILVRGNEAKVVGLSQVVVIRNNEKSKLEQDGKLGVRNLLIDIYLPGDMFYIGMN